MAQDPRFIDLATSNIASSVSFIPHLIRGGALFGVIEFCKMNEMDPRIYLSFVFRIVADGKVVTTA